MSCLRHGEGVRLSTYLIYVLSNLSRCRVFDTYVLLALPRALDLHYRTCADVVPSARRIRVDCRVPHTAQLLCL